MSIRWAHGCVKSYSGSTRLSKVEKPQRRAFGKQECEGDDRLANRRIRLCCAEYWQSLRLLFAFYAENCFEINAGTLKANRLCDRCVFALCIRYFCSPLGSSVAEYDRSKLLRIGTTLWKSPFSKPPPSATRPSLRRIRTRHVLKWPTAVKPFATEIVAGGQEGRNAGHPMPPRFPATPDLNRHPPRPRHRAARTLNWSVRPLLPTQLTLPYSPPTVSPSMRMVGAATEPRNSRSLAISERFMNISFRLPATVISSAG